MCRVTLLVVSVTKTLMQGVPPQSPIPTPATPGMDIRWSTWSSSTSATDFVGMTSALSTSPAPRRRTQNRTMPARRHGVAMVLHPPLPPVRQPLGPPDASESDRHRIGAGRRRRFTHLIGIGATALFIDVILVEAIIGRGVNENVVPPDIDTG